MRGEIRRFNSERLRDPLYVFICIFTDIVAMTWATSLSLGYSRLQLRRLPVRYQCDVSFKTDRFPANEERRFVSLVRHVVRRQKGVRELIIC